MTNIQKTEIFLKEQFDGCESYQWHPDKKARELEHAYRTAHAAGEIARREGLDEEGLIIGALLHDVGYCQCAPKNREEHGRISARIARPFLERLELGAERVREICYGIAIHVDGKADFPGEESPFARSIRDAEDVDRYGAYGIFLDMSRLDFLRQGTIAVRKQALADRLDFIQRALERKRATETARRMIDERLRYQQQYYGRVLKQLEQGEGIEALRGI